MNNQFAYGFLVISFKLKTKYISTNLILFSFLLSFTALAQVNTETFRKVEMQNGWHGMLSTSIKYRYDCLPPPDVKKYDFELNNGISVTL